LAEVVDHQPTLTTDQRIAVLAVCVALLLPAFPALWKAAQLRGDTIGRWRARVDIAHSGLTERAIEALRDLQAQANQLLGGMDTFDPLLAMADPGPLATQATRFNKLLRARGLLRRRYDRQVRLVGFGCYLVAAYALGLVVICLYVGGAEHACWTLWAGVALAGAAFIAGGLLLGIYAYIENKLTGAEIMAAPPPAGGQA
jgi:hypothetical protein